MIILNFGLLVLNFELLKNGSKLEFGHPDEISATEISSRWNKGNKDSIGQVGQADLRRFSQINIS
jgi:hypothetical protein